MLFFNNYVLFFIIFVKSTDKIIKAINKPNN
jgi:hypothetical protein